MKSQKRVYEFRKGEELISISVNSLLRPQYGSFIWKSSEYMAEYISAFPALFDGKNVLELGCGAGLAGIVCAACTDCAQVILSDLPDEPIVLSNCRRNCEANAVNHKTSVVRCDDAKAVGTVRPL